MEDYQRGFNAGLLAGLKVAEQSVTSSADRATLRAYRVEVLDARNRMEGRKQDGRPMIWADVALAVPVAHPADFGL